MVQWFMFSLAKLEGLENKGPATLTRVHSGFEFQVLDIQIINNFEEWPKLRNLREQPTNFNFFVIVSS